MNLKSITGSIYKSSLTTPGIGISITLNTLHSETFFFISIAFSYSSYTRR